MNKYEPQLHFTWTIDNTRDPYDTLDDVRTQLLAVPHATGRSKPTPNAARARALHEARGLKALTAPDRNPFSNAAKYIVRIYYISNAGEKLCFDTAPLTAQTGYALYTEYQKGSGPCVDAEMFDRDLISADAIAQGCYLEPRFGARLVKLPSQAT